MCGCAGSCCVCDVSVCACECVSECGDTRGLDAHYLPATPLTHTFTPALQCCGGQIVSTSPLDSQCVTD